MRDENQTTPESGWKKELKRHGTAVLLSLLGLVSMAIFPLVVNLFY